MLCSLLIHPAIFERFFVTDHQLNSKDQPGDLIVQVDGESFVGRFLDALMQLYCQTMSSDVWISSLSSSKKKVANVIIVLL